MKKHMIIFLSVIFVLGTNMLLISTSQAGMIIKEKFNSQILGREYVYNVYIPDGYNSSNFKYPVFYLLHGSGGNENSWPVKGKIQQTTDLLIASGEIPPSIIVMPYHKNAWWVDGIKEPAESVFIKELIPHIDTK